MPRPRPKTLSGVKLDKGWIKGELNTVTSDFSGQNVTIDGGSLNVNLNDKQNRDGIKQQKRDIQFKIFMQVIKCFRKTFYLGF